MVLASLALLLLAYVPGAALAWAATAPGSRARYALLGVSPALTLGVVGAAFGWSGALGLGWSALTILLIEVVVAVAAMAARVLRLRTVARLDPVRLVATHWARRRPDLLALAGAEGIVLGIGTWLLGRLAVPPGWDAMNHGFLARMVMDRGAVESQALCVTGSTQSAPACDFYPLSPHVLWVQTAELTGQPLSHGMLATVMLLGPSLAVVSIFVIARYLGAATSMAFAAAAACGLVGPLWQILNSGRLTVQLGAAMSPGVALIVFMALRHRKARAMTVLTGVALGGLMLTHTYDVVFAVVFGLGLLLTLPIRWRSLGRLAAVMGGLLLGTVLVVGPQWRGLFGAQGERGVLPARFPGELGRALGIWLAPERYVGLFVPRPAATEALWSGSTSARLACAFVLVGWLMGLAISVRSRWRWVRPFAVIHVFTIVLSVYLATSNSAFRDAVGGLFYGSPERVIWSSALAPAVLSVAGWTALLTMGVHAARRWRPNRPPSPRAERQHVIRGAPVVAFAVLSMVIAFQPVVRDSPAVFAWRTPISPAYQRVGLWLTEHLRPGAVVADDLHRDFVTWMAVDQDVPVLKGMVPITKSGQRDWERREKVWRVLTGSVTPSVRCLEDRYHVQFVVVSSEHMPSGRRTYEPSALAHSQYLRLVHGDGPLRVYQVNDLCS